MACSAVAGALLFAEMTSEVGTFVGAVAWAWKLAMLGDGDGVMTGAYGPGSGIELTQAEVSSILPMPSHTTLLQLSLDESPS